MWAAADQSRVKRPRPFLLIETDQPDFRAKQKRPLHQIAISGKQLKDFRITDRRHFICELEFAIVRTRRVEETATFAVKRHQHRAQLRHFRWGFADGSFGKFNSPATQPFDRFATGIAIPVSINDDLAHFLEKISLKKFFINAHERWSAVAL